MIINPYIFGGGDPYFSSVSLLLPLNGSNGSTSFPDSSLLNNSVTGNGNAQISTAQSKWGGSSLLLDGTGDYLSIPDNNGFDFGTGNYTIEFWLRWNSLTGYQTIYDHGYTSSGGLLLQTGLGNGRIIVYASGSVVFTEADALGTGSWGFYQLVRSSTTLTLYRGGVSKGSATNTTNLGSTSSVYIGARGSDATYAYNGYMQDFRITKGVARANEVPTAAFPTS
jgi:hypothetical protein